MHKQLRQVAILLGLIVFFAVFSLGNAHAVSVFFNEIHYDNAGADTNEAIEIAGPVGTDLTGWSILLYSGNGRNVYNTINLTGSITDQQNGFGTLSFFIAGIQNGSPDGLALLDDSNTVIQFLSYEGSSTAIGGLANGILSAVIGVAEAGSTPAGFSLQLIGSGSDSSDFTWVTAMANTFGTVNAGQTFTGGGQQPVPEPSTLLFLTSGLTGLGFRRWRQQQQQ